MSGGKQLSLKMPGGDETRERFAEKGNILNSVGERRPIGHIPRSVAMNTDTGALVIMQAQWPHIVTIV